MVDDCVTVNGYEVAYSQARRASPMLFFVHGNSSSRTAFRHQMHSRVLARYRRIAIDLPGHGASSRPGDPATGYGLETLADVLRAIVVRLDAEEAVFVGHSFGDHLLLQAAPLLFHMKGLLIFGAPPLSRPPRIEAAFLPNPAGQVFLQEDLSDNEVKARGRASTASGVPPSGFCDDVRRTDPIFRSTLAACLASLAYRGEVETLRQSVVDVWIEGSLYRHLLETGMFGIDQHVVFGRHHCAWDPKGEGRPGL
jgi:pimeloyl-ACP methyl ester carboxylesterase